MKSRALRVGFVDVARCHNVGVNLCEAKFFAEQPHPMLQAELKVIEGKQQGKSISLNVKKFLIGREQDCQLRPTSDLVSRHHCVFTQDDYTLRLRDLGSTNGTFVNGERIQGQVVLNDGDRVQIGKLAFQVTIREPAGASVSTGASGGDLSLDDLTSQPDSADGIPTANADPLSDSALLGNSETEINTGKTDAGMRDAGKTMEIPAYDASAFASAETESGMFGGDTTVIAPKPASDQPVSPLGPPPRAPGARPATPPGGYPAQMPGAPAMGYPGAPYQGGYQQPIYAPQPQPMYPPNPYAQPGYPGMGGYSGQPVYQQPAYPQPMYPPMSGYPAMQYQQAPPQAPAPPIETPSAAGNKRNNVASPPVSLPPPESTGAKAPEPKPEEVRSADGSAAPVAKKPSSAAADIIRAHMQRRPNSNG